MAIPKKIHYVWVGSNRFPDDAAAEVTNWRKLMPDFSFQQWNETNIDFSSQFMRSAYAAREFARVADYARLLAVYNHGGIYFDHDVEVFKDFTPLLGNACFFGSQTMRADEPHIIATGVIAAAPGHPFVARMLAELDKLDGRDDLGAYTGPGFVSDMLRAAGLTKPPSEIVVIDGVTIYPMEYFFPYDWTQKFTPACLTENTYSVHHWAHTWKRKRALKNRLIKRLCLEIAKLSVPLGFAIQMRCNSLMRKWRSLA